MASALLMLRDQHEKIASRIYCFMLSSIEHNTADRASGSIRDMPNHMEQMPQGKGTEAAHDRGVAGLEQAALLELTVQLTGL